MRWGKRSSILQEEMNSPVSGYNGESSGNGLELQGDIGHDPENGDDGYDGAKPLGFAIAGTEKVGDRGDVVFLAYSYDLAQQEPPGESLERRA